MEDSFLRSNETSNTDVWGNFETNKEGLEKSWFMEDEKINNVPKFYRDIDPELLKNSALLEGVIIGKFGIEFYERFKKNPDIDLLDQSERGNRDESVEFCKDLSVVLQTRQQG